jgi:hypothetical protein
VHIAGERRGALDSPDQAMGSRESSISESAMGVSMEKKE